MPTRGAAGPSQKVQTIGFPSPDTRPRGAALRPLRLREVPSLRRFRPPRAPPRRLLQRGHGPDAAPGRGQRGHRLGPPAVVGRGHRGRRDRGPVPYGTYDHPRLRHLPERPYRGRGPEHRRGAAVHRGGDLRRRDRRALPRTRCPRRRVVPVPGRGDHVPAPFRAGSEGRPQVGALPAAARLAADALRAVHRGAPGRSGRPPLRPGRGARLALAAASAAPQASAPTATA